jgi:O-antigen/teichoic acid export membrane protein
MFSWLIGRNMAQASVVIADQGFTSMASFLTGVMIARTCVKADYGVFIMGLSLIRFMIGIQESLVSIPYTIQYPRFGRDRQDAYLGSTVSLQLTICLLAWFSLAFILRLSAVLGPEVERNAIVSSVCLASLALMTREFVRATLLAELRVWRTLAMGLAANGLTVGALAWVYFNGTLKASWAFLIIAVCSGLPSLLVGICHWRRIRFITRELLSDCLTNWNLGRWLLARTLAFVLAVSSYPFALAFFHSTTEVAVYGACFQLASLLNPLFMGLSSYLRPKTARIAAGDCRRLRSVILTVMAGLTLPIVVLVATALIWGDWAMVRVYGPAYDGSRWILLLCVLGIGMYVLGNPLSIALEALKRTDMVFKGRGLGAATTLTVGLAATRVLGAPGAAMGLFLSHMACSVYWLCKVQILNGDASDEEATLTQEEDLLQERVEVSA